MHLKVNSSSWFFGNKEPLQKNEDEQNIAADASDEKPVSNPLQSIKNLVSSIATPVCNSVTAGGINLLRYALKQDDEKFLIQLTGCDISIILKQVAPKLPIFLQNFFKAGFAHQFSQNEAATMEKFGEFVMVRIIANVAAWHYPDALNDFHANRPIQQVVPLNKFLVTVTQDLLLLMATEIDAVDTAVSQGADLTPELFEPLACKLLERIWPTKTDSTASIAAGLNKSIFELCGLQKKISEYFANTYKPIGHWLSGEDFSTEKTGGLEEIIQTIETPLSYAIDCLAKHYIQEDKILLQKLTGVDDVFELVKVISPKLLHGLLEKDSVKDFLSQMAFDGLELLKRNRDTVDSVCISLTLKLIANVAQDIFEKEINSETTVKIDDFILKISMGVSDIFGKHLQAIKQHPQDQQLEDELFQPLASQLLATMMPKHALFHSFLTRRKEKVTQRLSEELRKFYESIALRNDAEVYKQRLREILWDPSNQENPTDDPLPTIPTEELAIEYGIEKIVQQLYNACFHITNIGRGFVAEKFSDPSVVIDQMQETINAKALSDKLAADLADAILTYSEEEDGVEDSQSLFVYLRKFFSSFDISDSLLKKICDWTCSILDDGVDEDALIFRLQKKFNKESIPSHLFKGVAGGVSKLIQLNHKISDKKMIIDHLRMAFPHAKLTDSQIVFIADDALELIQSNLKIDISVIERKLLKNNNLNLSNTTLTEVTSEIFLLINPDNPLNWLTPTVQNALQLTLFKALVHLLEKVDRTERTPLKKLFPAALQILFEVCAEELPIIVSGIKNITDPDYQLLMEPFVDKIIHIFFEDDNGGVLEDHLPIPDEWKPAVVDLLRNNAHKLILPILDAMTSWIDAIDVNRKRLNTVYGNSHASEACRIVSSFAVQSIPYHLQESHKEFTETFLNNCSSLFVSQDGHVPSKNKRKLMQMISYTLESIAKNNTPAMKDASSFLQKFCEAALLRCFADLSECLDSLDQSSKNDPDGTLLVQGTTILLRELKDHLSLIANVKEELKQYKSGKIPLDVMMQKFTDANHLHSALADSTGKDKDLFFKNFSEKLFDIVGVNKNAKLPLPQFLKYPIWNMFEGSLMPTILSRLFEKVKNPHTLNLILINLFEQINADSDTIDISMTNDDIRKYNDDPQKNLEAICGKLTQALVKMQPSAITRWAIKKPKVRDLAAQAMGQPLRDTLQANSMIEIFKNLITSLIPNLHPGYWNDQTGTYICVKDGTQTVIAEPDFSHIFPRTRVAKRNYNRTQRKAENIARKKMVEGITRTIENQTHYIFLGIFKKLWLKFRELINFLIDKTTGPSTKNRKKRINAFLDGAAHYFIKPALIITTYPIILTVKKLLRFYFVNKSTGFANDVYHGIHPNVFYKVIDDILNFIGNAKSSQEISTSDSQSISGLSLTT